MFTTSPAVYPDPSLVTVIPVMEPPAPIPVILKVSPEPVPPSAVALPGV